jgi:uncharacterized protein YciI
MFIAILTYQKSLELVEENLEEHNQYLDKNYQLGHFIFSGRRNPRIGGVILINQDSEDKVLNIIKEDPFYVNEIANYELIDFVPSKYAEGFSTFIK